MCGSTTAAPAEQVVRLPDVENEVLFISHEWAGHEHPDPEGQQVSRGRAKPTPNALHKSCQLGSPRLQLSLPPRRC